MMEVVYIGEKFYRESKSTMSSIYTIEEYGFHRTDWGKVQIALAEGKSIHIRPATRAELVPFEKELVKIKERRK